MAAYLAIDYITSLERCSYGARAASVLGSRSKTKNRSLGLRGPSISLARFDSKNDVFQAWRALCRVAFLAPYAVIKSSSKSYLFMWSCLDRSITRDSWISKRKAKAKRYMMCCDECREASLFK